jgi:hypothetical protein
VLGTIARLLCPLAGVVRIVLRLASLIFYSLQVTLQLVG